ELGEPERILLDRERTARTSRLDEFAACAADAAARTASSESVDRGIPRCAPSAVSPRLRPRPKPRRLEHHLVQLRPVARDDVAAAQHVGAAGEVGHAAAGLGDEQCAGGDVPRVQVGLPVGVVVAGGDAGEVEGGAAGAADVAAAQDQVVEGADVVLDDLVALVGEAGGEERLAQVAGPADVQALAVAGRAGAVLG